MQGSNIGIPSCRSLQLLKIRFLLKRGKNNSILNSRGMKNNESIIIMHDHRILAIMPKVR